VEVATEVLKKRIVTVSDFTDAKDARRYLDSALLTLPELAKVNVSQVAQSKFQGSWFTCKKTDSSVTLLYFHGGGYSFYPSAYRNFIALVTLATQCKTFALDYSLSPEHRFPTQLEEALNAYRWLLENGTDPAALVVAGDSAGGNLTLVTLLALRDLKLPLPALAVALSPPTDFVAEYDSMTRNEDFDWLERRMLGHWADWYCDLDQRQNPLVSPFRADLRGLSPIYIQAGQAELLFDSIQAFADGAKRQGADVVLESWDDMNHVFQIFGNYSPHSKQALQRLCQVMHAKVAVREKKTVSV